MIKHRVAFGAGCYWGTEKYLKVDFGRKRYPESMIKGFVGFMGPHTAKANPTYKEVCSGTTGHVEVFDMTFQGGPEMFEHIVRFFFQFHDPTTLNKQKNDVGTQYASVIFCYDDQQIAIANKVKTDLQKLIDTGKVTCFSEPKVSTAVLRATTFYAAHDEHQEYLAKNPSGYCNHRVRFADWPE
jgi:peptide-methionine (S)-S-oxide reductase